MSAIPCSRRRRKTKRRHCLHPEESLWWCRPNGYQVRPAKMVYFLNSAIVLPFLHSRQFLPHYPRFFSLAEDVSGPPDKPLPSEPPTYTEPSTSPPPANSNQIANNLHEQNSDGVALPGEAQSDGEDSFKATSPPSSPDTCVFSYFVQYFVHYSFSRESGEWGSSPSLSFIWKRKFCQQKKRAASAQRREEGEIGCSGARDEAAAKTNGRMAAAQEVTI